MKIYARQHVSPRHRTLRFHTEITRDQEQNRQSPRSMLQARLILSSLYSMRVNPLPGSRYHKVLRNSHPTARKAMVLWIASKTMMVSMKKSMMTTLLMMTTLSLLIREYKLYSTNKSLGLCLVNSKKRVEALNPQLLKMQETKVYQRIIKTKTDSSRV